jgi:hypothetical protein
MRKTLKCELELQNVISSVIPGSTTSSVQPLDSSVNKLLKGLIRNQEDDHWDNF